MQINAWRANNTTTPLFAVGLLDVTGGVKATTTMYIGGAIFPGGFAVTVRIAGFRVPVVIPAGTLQSDLQAAIIAAINAMPALPVVAAVATGGGSNVLLTAKNAGTVGNSINVRFSDHWIKGQLPHVRSPLTKRQAALDASVAPLGQGAPLPPPPAIATTSTPRKHKAGRGKHGPVYQTGHATDAGVTRYRPKVWMTRAEAGLDTVDEQASWRARLTAAQANKMEYVVVGHRGGPDKVLWRPNTLVAVTDAVRGLQGVDQLIAGVRYLDGEDGARTILRVVDPLSYSLDEERIGPRRAGRAAPQHQKAVDATSRRYR